MEKPTLDKSATSAKYALLAHPHNNYVVRTAAELRAHIAAEVDAAREPWARGKAHRLDTGCDGDDE